MVEVVFKSDNPPPVTLKVSEPVLPMPPFVEVTEEVVFTKVPPAAFTSTFTIQVPPATIEPVLNNRLLLPAVGAKTGELEALQPEVLAFGRSATSIPVGNASVKPTPVKVVPAFGFVISNSKAEVAPAVIELGVKDLLIAGGEMTNKVADAVLPAPPFVEVTASLVLR